MIRTLLLLLLLGQSAISLAQIQLYRQRFLVEHQPQPKSFTFDNTFPLSDEKVTLNNSQESFEHHYNKVQGFLLPIMNREKVLMSFGMGYATDRYDGFESTDIAAQYKAFWLQLFNTGAIGDDYFWRSLTAWGSYGQGIALDQSRTHKLTQLLQIGRKWNPNFNTSIGGLYLSNFGDPQFIPIVHISYSTGQWVFDLMPIDANIRYLMNENWHLIAQHLINSRNYNSTSQAIKHSFNEVSLRIEGRIKGALWSEVGLTKPYNTQLENIADGDTITISDQIDNGLVLYAGLFLRFGSK